jgi:hypothetical protein
MSMGILCFATKPVGNRLLAETVRELLDNRG